MCGRFTLTTSADELAESFDLPKMPSIEPRYNIAPTQKVAGVLQDAKGAGRGFQWFHWGLIPSWATDPAIGNRMINARAETIIEKPAFRNAFKRRRCLVLADGFYEWRKLAKGKQPVYIRMADAKPFAFAALWEHWNGPGDSAIDSCTLITTTPNERIEPIHDRMPVILAPKNYDRWLDPKNEDVAALQKLLVAYPAKGMTVYPVGKRVNAPTFDDPACIRALEKTGE